MTFNHSKGNLSDQIIFDIGFSYHIGIFFSNSTRWCICMFKKNEFILSYKQGNKMFQFGENVFGDFKDFGKMLLECNPHGKLHIMTQFKKIGHGEFCESMWTYEVDLVQNCTNNHFLFTCAYQNMNKNLTWKVNLFSCRSNLSPLLFNWKELRSTPNKFLHEPNCQNQGRKVLPPTPLNKPKGC